MLTNLQTLSMCKQQGTKKCQWIPYLHLEAHALLHQCPLQLQAPKDFVYLFQSACNPILATASDRTGTELFKSPPENKEKLDQMGWQVT